jgi:ribonuclease III
MSMDGPAAENAAHEDLERALGYRFKSAEQLTAALRHSSFVNEQPHVRITSNERLEFLGDAVLNLAVSHLLMRQYPDLTEGELSRNRAQLVNEFELAALAREIGLGPHLLLGKGESLTDGREKNSILADAAEAVIAAIYIDGGFEAAFGFVENKFRARLSKVNRSRHEADYKSMLQERVQSTYHEVPRYEIIDEMGPDHDKTFTVQMTVAGITAHGDGKSKKAAEQEAAKAGLDHLDRSD